MGYKEKIEDKYHTNIIREKSREKKRIIKSPLSSIDLVEDKVPKVANESN